MVREDVLSKETLRKAEKLLGRPRPGHYLILHPDAWKDYMAKFNLTEEQMPKYFIKSKEIAWKL